MKKLLLFLILTPLFYSLFLDNSFATTLTSTGEINYSIENSKLLTNLVVNFKNKGSNTAVLNYYTITLPYQNISNIKVTSEKHALSFTSRKVKTGMELIINTNTKVLPSNSRYNLSVSFLSSSTVESDWSYAKLLAQISGLKITNITLNVDDLTQSVGFVEGADFTQKVSETKNIVSFANILQPEISILFGNPIVFEYQANKTVLNASNERMIYELPLPPTNNNQVFVLSLVSPLPSDSYLDGDGNILMRFSIQAQSQELISVKGSIVKQKGTLSDAYLPFHTENVGYWNITNQFELNRIDTFLKNITKEQLPLEIYNYVLDRLEIDKNSYINTNSFENSLRGGAQEALGRRLNSVPEDYNDLLIAALRLKSIPARLITGYIPLSSSYSQNGFFHSWVEYFDLKKGKWQILDPSLQDSLSKSKIYTESPNYIPLLIRGESPLKPKLPFLNNSDVVIRPVNTELKLVFDVQLHEDKIVNNGNIPVRVFDIDVDNRILLPNNYYAPKGESIRVESFKGDTKTFEMDRLTSDEKTTSKIFNESLIFFTFVLSFLTLNTIYSKLKKIWK